MVIDDNCDYAAVHGKVSARIAELATELFQQMAIKASCEHELISALLVKVIGTGLRFSVKYSNRTIHYAFDRLHALHKDGVSRVYCYEIGAKGKKLKTLRWLSLTDLGGIRKYEGPK